MEKVWSQSADDVNVAPPVRPTAHVGWDAIKKNYQAFWGTLDELTVAMENPAVNIEGNVAWVYGIEHASGGAKMVKWAAGLILAPASSSKRTVNG